MKQKFPFCDSKVVTAIVMFLSAITASESVVSPSDESLKPNGIRFPSWCNPDSIKILAEWKEVETTKQLQSCSADSIDSQGISLYSKLEVREVDLASAKVIWKISDGIGRGLASVKIFTPSVSIVDITGKGKYASFVGYIFKHDGADPIDVKFIAHLDGKKMAIRGSIPFHEMDADLYKMAYDKSFSIAPTAFRKVADSLLKSFIVRAYEAHELGGFLPYQMGGVRSEDE